MIVVCRNLVFIWLGRIMLLVHGTMQQLFPTP